MENINKRLKKENIYRLAFFIGELLLKNGGETYRVQRVCREFCSAHGYPHVSIVVVPTFIIIGDDRADGITFIKNIRNRTINLEKVAIVNQKMLELTNEKEINIEESIEFLKKIDGKESYSNAFKIFAAGISSAAFAGFFNITWMEAFLTLIISIISLYIKDLFVNIFKTDILGTISSCIFIGSLAILAKYFGLASSGHNIIIGSIVPLLPGVSITKSVADLVSGDYISGGARATEAFLTALGIGIGIGIAIDIGVKLGGTV